MLKLIAVLITCYNRKENTIQCIQSLFNQRGLYKEFILEVFLVDDDSSDGTSEAIKAKYPEVNIIKGNGDLYWNRGMFLAWKTATATKDYDYYMWLNDDTFLFNFALDTLFVDTFPNSIVCGVTKSSISDNLTYGGYSSKLKKALIPNNFYQNVDYCNGNCVLVPRDVFKKLGYLDPIFHHALGDFDYSLRATKKGFEIKIAPEYIGFCELHDTIPKWRNSSINLYNRLKYLYSPLSGCHPSEIFIFDLRHNDLFKAILHFFTIHLRCFFPKFWAYIF